MRMVFKQTAPKSINSNFIYVIRKMNRLSSKIDEFFNKERTEILFNNKIYTVLDFLRSDIKVIEKYLKIPFKDVLEVRKCLLKQYSARPVNGLNEYHNFLENSAIISTGIENVDRLLEGGLTSGNIYELCGSPASGKTSFCYNLIKQVVSKSNDKIYFIDTKQNFSGRTLKSMLDNLEKENIVNALNCVLVKRIFTKYELLNALRGIKNEIDDGLKIRVIIIDSLPILFLDSNDVTENNNILSHFTSLMQLLANENHVCFFITNLITLWNEGDFKNQNEYTETVACGKYWYHIPNIRMKIEKQNSLCKLSIINGPENLVNKPPVNMEICENVLK